jgi:hypothetical protein
LAAFLPSFYGLQIMLAFNTMGSFQSGNPACHRCVAFPIYIRAPVNVFSGRGAEVARHGVAGKRVPAAVQLHDPGGAHVRVPAPHLRWWR